MEEPKKTRLYAFTTFDLTIDYNQLVGKGKQLSYLAYGEETCPKTKRQHHQGFLRFFNPRGKTKKVLKKIGALLGNAHVEPVFGSLAENEAYCSKEGSLHEFGDKPQQGSRQDLRDVVQRIATGERVDDILMDDPIFYHQYGRTLREAEAISLRKKFRTWQTEGVWYHGDSGAGKSHRAFEGYNPETHFVKDLTVEWWDGYTGQPIVILNEFRGQIPLETLLTFVDKWPQAVKWRNKESVPFLAKKIIVTCIMDPIRLYENGNNRWESMTQLTRRFRIVKVQPRNQVMLRRPRYSDYDRSAPDLLEIMPAEPLAIDWPESHI